MKKLFFTLSLMIMMVCSSCYRDAKAIDDANLSPQEREAIGYVKKHLDKKERLIEADVARGPLPVELMADDFKKYRDDVYKAGLDYKSCQTRNIAVGMEKAQNKIMTDQAEIVAKCAEWQVEQGTSEYLFVLATIEALGNNTKYIKKEIGVFNPVTLQNDFILPITKPVQNTAAMILSASNGELFQYATDGAYEIKALASKTTNPILQFILEADPI